MVAYCPNYLYFMLIRLQLCYDWYGTLMMAVLCALLAIDVALSALLYVFMITMALSALLEALLIFV